METIKVSIIIPVHNSELFLEKLFESILKQTYKNYEVIIINDGSTDESLSIIKKYEQENENFKSKTIINNGPGAARRIGFEMSEGNLLFFIDSDDYIPNIDALKEIAKIYEMEKFDILFFDFIIKQHNKEKIINAFRKENLQQGKHNDLKYLHKNEIRGALWSKIFVREKMKKEYFCDLNNYEDYYTTYKYLNNCENFYYTKNVCYYSNRDNINSISKVINSKKIEDTVELLKKIYDETKFKEICSIIIYNFYLINRRRIDKNTYNLKNKDNVENKIKELKPYFNLIKLLKMKQNLKKCMIYIYYELKDVVYRRT